MRSALTFGLLLLVGCGSDTFKGDDGGAGDASSDALMMVEGSTPDGGEAGPMAKPRMFVSLMAAQPALLAWDDPEGLAIARQPNVTIPLPMALDVVAAKKRLFVAGGSAIHVFDGALQLASSSMPNSFSKMSFQGVSQADPLNVIALHWEPQLDILTTADDGIAALQLFKNASSVNIPPMASAKIFNDADDILYPALSVGGQAFGARNGANQTLFFNGAPGASGGTNPSSNFVFGSGRPVIAGNRLYIPGKSGSIGGASIYVYTLPVMTMVNPLAEINTAFGGPGMSDLAGSLAVSPTMLASIIWKANSNDSYICVMSNLNNLSATSMCDHTIPMSGKGLRIAEHKGSLYVSVPGRLDIYRQPMTDTKASVTLMFGGAMEIATGIAFVDPG